MITNISLKAVFTIFWYVYLHPKKLCLYKYLGVDVSIKEGVEFVKEELTQDEKLLEGLIKVERFYKRNRVAILSISVALVLGGIGYSAVEYMKEQKLLRANSALLKLQSNPKDTNSLKILKENNPSLAQLFLLKEATISGDIKTLEELSKSKDETISDLAMYHLSVFKEDKSKIKEYRLKSNSLLKDLAIFDEAYLLFKDSKVEDAKRVLTLIPQDSPIKSVANMLDHFVVKGNR